MWSVFFASNVNSIKDLRQLIYRSFLCSRFFFISFVTICMSISGTVNLVASVLPPQLGYLGLQGNRLSGTVDLTSLPRQLESLLLGDNVFTGKFPVSRWWHWVCESQSRICVVCQTKKDMFVLIHCRRTWHWSLWMWVWNVTQKFIVLQPNQMLHHGTVHDVTEWAAVLPRADVLRDF